MATKLIVGCGYLGMPLALHWRAAGDTVYTTTRNARHATEWRGQGLLPLLCDVTDPASLTALPQVDTVVYCVGFDRSAGKSMREVYVQGLRNVLTALPAPGRFLYVSSVSVYGQTDGAEVDETSATVPGEESGKVVLEAEQVVRAALPDASLLRCAGIYGPGRLLRAQALREGQSVPGDPERWLNLIHQTDGVAAIAAAATAPAGIYNLADGHPVRRRDFFTYLAALIGAPPPHFAPTPEVVNRRVNNRRMLEQLNVQLTYPDYREGLRAASRT